MVFGIKLKYLILFCYFHSDVKSAVDVVSKMKECGLHPNIDTYTNLLCSFAKTGDLNAIQKTIDQCNAEEIQIPDRSILEVIYELSVNDHTDKIDHVVQFAEKSSEYNQYAVSVILRLSNHGLDDAAYTVLSTMTQSGNEAGEQSQTGDFLIKHMVKRNRPIEKIEAICKNLQQNERNLKAFATFRQAVMRDRSTQLASAIYNCLADQHLKEAVELANQRNVYLDPNIFQWPLISALRATNDFKSYVTLVRYIHDNYSRKGEIEPVANEVADFTEILGDIVYNTIAELHENHQIKLFTNVLNGLMEEGLTISRTQAERIRTKFDSLVSDNISFVITQLASGKLQPVPVKPMGWEVTSESLERIIKMEEERGNDIKELRHLLLGIYYNNKDVIKYAQCLEELENKNVYFNKSHYARLIKMQADCNDLFKALETFDRVRVKIPKFVLDLFKTLNIAYLLLEKNETEKALKWLKANKKTVTAIDDARYRNLCWKILNSLAEAGKTDDLQKVFNSLVVNNYVKVDSNQLLGPLVRVHLVNADFNTAVDTFEKIVYEYHVTAMNNELYLKLIQNDDQTTLQRVCDITSRIHGMKNSLLDLTFSYIELGHVKLAQKLLNKIGSDIDSQRFFERL